MLKILLVLISLIILPLHAQMNWSSNLIEDMTAANFWAYTTSAIDQNDNTYLAYFYNSGGPIKIEKWNGSNWSFVTFLLIRKQD